jgi:O-acetyl-ADP-ribose deacetylase (regulator of RNase III)
MQLLKGDITTFEANVIVTAANSFLRGGGGVDGAIHQAAGPELLEELQRFKGCETGDAVITNAYNLNAKYVIHAVGPIYKDGESGEDKLLASAYEKSIVLAKSVDAKSILFPAISTGVYGYPLKPALTIAIDSIHEACKKNEAEMKVTMVCFDQETYQLMSELLEN